MPYRLHTAVSDSYRDMDPDQAAEMRVGAGGTDDYAREVRGSYDSAEPPDYDERDEGSDEDCCEECGGAVMYDGETYLCLNTNCPTTDGHDDAGGSEDFGWDGGMEE